MNTTKKLKDSSHTINKNNKFDRIYTFVNFYKKGFR